MTGYNDAIAYNQAIPYNGSPTPPGGPPTLVYTVEVAFGVDALTTPASGDWIDVSDYASLIDTRRGKTHELAESQAGTATIVLKNRDRRFDPAYASSPYYPDVVPLTRIRCSITYNGITYRRFEGFVEDWGQTWPSRVQAGTGAAECVVKAVDAFKILGPFELTSYSSEVLADEPAGYWRLDETQGEVVRSDGEIEAEGTYTGNVRVGTMPGPLVGGTAVPAFDGVNAYVELGAPEDLQIRGDVTVEAWVFPSTSTGQIVNGNDAFALLMNAGSIRFGHTTNGGDPELVIDDTSALTVGAWNHIVAVRDTARRDLVVYVNGVETKRANYTRPPGDDWTLTLSNPNSAPLGLLSSTSLEGKLAHVAIYDRILEPSRIAAHYAATFDTFAEEASGAHVGEILDLVGWPAGERSIDAGLSDIAAVTPDGNALSWILAVAETTEQGIFHVAPSGDVTFIDRQTLLTAASAATFGDGGGAEIAYADIEVRNDDADLWTTVTVTGAAGDAHSATDAAAQARYGPRTLEISGALASNPEELTDQAAYLLGRYKAPAARVESVAFVVSTDGPTILQVLQRDIGDRITVKRRPPGGGTITQDCRIEAIQHVSRPDRPLTTKWSLVPVDPITYFVLGTSQLNGSDVLAY